MVRCSESAGKIDVSAPVTMNAAPVNDITPNRLPDRADAEQRHVATTNGKAVDAMATAAMGSGLKSKKSVSENGSVNMSTTPDSESHIGKIASTMSAGLR